MELIREENEEILIPDPCREKDEDTEEKIDLMLQKEESQEPNEVEVKHHDFRSGEKSFSCSTETEKNFTVKRIQKTSSKSSFTCHECGKSFSRERRFRILFENSYWRDPIYLPTVWKTFPKGRRPSYPHQNSHWRAAFHLPSVWEVFLTQRKYEVSHKGSHWRDALHVSSVWKEFRSTKTVEKSFATLLWRRTAVFGVWQEVCRQDQLLQPSAHSPWRKAV